MKTIRRFAGSLALCGIAMLSACGTQRSAYSPYSARHLRLTPGRYYPPPGPPSDPWGPYIQDAAAHFSVPETWIRAVMRQESAGEAQALSPAGAMGLMQVMPATYDMLRQRYGLGDDPYEPHDNILAGTAYIKEMYERFGSPGFLAAYNAGPNRLDTYLTSGEPLPTETVNYVAAIAPRLGSDTPATGPLSVYAGNTYAPQPVPGVSRTPTPVTCDLDAAYDPTQPCAPAPVVVAQVAPPPVQYPAPSVLYHPTPVVPVAERPPPVVASIAPVPPIIAPPLPSGGAWAIQVGAFTSPSAARVAANTARSTIPTLLAPAKVELSTTEPFGNSVLFRARLTNLSANSAASACARLSAAQIPCLLVRPS